MYIEGVPYGKGTKLYLAGIKFFSEIIVLDIMIVVTSKLES